MKIAIIGSNIFTIPLEAGKIHAPLMLTWNLANKLAEYGHQVTYYGVVDENTVDINQNITVVKPELSNDIDKMKDPATKDNLWFLARVINQQSFMANILKDSVQFDLVYSWFASYIGPVAGMCDKPVVITHHDSTNMEKYNVVFKAFESKNVFMVPISKYMKKMISYGNMLGVVHHGIDIEKVKPNTPEDYFCWIGRVAPGKGLHTAMKAAIKANVKLKIIGPMLKSLSDFGKVGDYIDGVKKMIKENSNIEYLGVFTQEETYDFISKAKGLIFPTDGMESFSMVTAEAIMAGTPVIATKKGPIPEIIQNGKNGYLIKSEKDVDGFVDAIRKIDKIDRDTCRKSAVDNFSLEKMASGYEKQFKIAVKKWSKNAKN